MRKKDLVFLCFLSVFLTLIAVVLFGEGFNWIEKGQGIHPFISFPAGTIVAALALFHPLLWKDLS